MAKKIEVIQEGERKELELKSIKGKDIDKLMNSLIEAQNAPEDEIGVAMQNYLSVQKSLASKVSGLSIDELDELDVDDRSKIYEYVSDKMSGAMGFTKLLSK